MAGNRSMACAEGRLSLARERRKVRVNSKVPLIVPTPHLYPLPRQGKGDRARKSSRDSDLMRRAEGPNILWPQDSRTPLIVFFACNS